MNHVNVFYKEYNTHLNQIANSAYQLYCLQDFFAFCVWNSSLLRICISLTCTSFLKTMLSIESCTIFWIYSLTWKVKLNYVLLLFYNMVYSILYMKIVYLCQNILKLTSCDPSHIYLPHLPSNLPKWKKWKAVHVRALMLVHWATLISTEQLFWQYSQAVQLLNTECSSLLNCQFIIQLS